MSPATADGLRNSLDSPFEFHVRRQFKFDGNIEAQIALGVLIGPQGASDSPRRASEGLRGHMGPSLGFRGPITDSLSTLGSLKRSKTRHSEKPRKAEEDVKEALQRARQTDGGTYMEIIHSRARVLLT